MLDISLTPLTDLDPLGPRWRALEAASDGGFFRSWSFLGCRAAERFGAPMLLSVRQDGVDLALGLLNRAGGRLYLGRTGDAGLDTVFVEHNGLLVRRGADAVLVPALRTLAASAPVMLSGIDDAHLAAARQAGLVELQDSQVAPALNLRDLPIPYLSLLSANARSQIGRAIRLYGPSLKLNRAGDTVEALAWFAALVRLHQARWSRRGQPGAFAHPAVLDFHAALIRAAAPRGEAEMLSATAAGEEVGYLYNFRHGDRVFCYQSGFVPAPDSRLKPGLVCHTLAVELYRAEGVATYDLLAGPARYKSTLAPRGGQMLHWATLYEAHSWQGRGRILVASALARARRRLSGKAEPAGGFGPYGEGGDYGQGAIGRS
jgi:CelD/BcsL family acetyltransferase involved in cellulose biosynthesis